MSDLAMQSVLDIRLQADKPPMLQIASGVDSSAWTAENRDSLRAAVAEHGSILVRGLGLQTVAEVTSVFQQLADRLIAEKEAFDPRTSYGNGVYAAAKWAANQPMCSHHELSYTCEFPSLMLFACLHGATAGGGTGVADSTELFDMLPPGLVDRFEREGWLLTRTYNEEMGSSIAESFGTDDRASVEAYCRANAIEFEWQPDGGLQTRQRRSAIIHHPNSGQRCWFNQIAFLNEWTLDPEVREYLIEVYGAEGLPFNTFYGNGDPISEDVIELINEIYEVNILREPLQAGDLMLIDNIRTAHSREAFEGDREVLVGMADPVRLADCAPTITVS